MLCKLVHCFSSRIYGLRKYKTKVKKIVEGIDRMALRKGKIVEAAGVLLCGGAGEKEEGRSIRTETRGIRKEAREILLCPSAPLLLCNPYAAYPSA